MKLNFPTPPQEVASILIDDHEEFAGRKFSSIQKFATDPERGKFLDRGAELQPHKQYVIPTSALLGDSPIASAREVGWRGIDASLEGQVGSRLVSTRQDGNLPELAEVNTGPLSVGTLEIFTQIVQEQADEEFEFRFLLLPQIYVAALWLHAPDRDAFVPIVPSGDALKAGTRYEAEEFFRATRELAGRLTAFDSTPPEIPTEE